MKTLPPVGTKVRYIGTRDFSDKDVIGTVLEAHHGSSLRDERGRRYIEEDWVVVSVHDLPERWTYPGTSKFAPSISDIEPLS